MVTRRALSPRLRAEVLASGPCVYCNQPSVVVDHDIPVVRGGTDDKSNLVPSCYPCNARKNTMTGDEYRAAYPNVGVPVDRVALADALVAVRRIADLRKNGPEATRVILTYLHFGEGLTYRQIQDLTGFRFATAQRIVMSGGI